MLKSMVPDWGPVGTLPPPNAAPLAWALEQMADVTEDGLWAPLSEPGESVADVRARLMAAHDILDELLIEYASTHGEAR